MLKRLARLLARVPVLNGFLADLGRAIHYELIRPALIELGDAEAMSKPD